MKKTMLWAALFTLTCSQVQADNPPPATQAPAPNAAVAAPTPAPAPAQQVQPTAQAPQTNQPIGQPTTMPSAPAQVVTINCDYKISADTKQIDQSLVKTWSEKAIVQAFEFDPTNMDMQMQKLQACFTEQGWSGFNTALQKSGNIDAIKTQKLTVSSQVDGQSLITEAKDNQWKITLPLQVVYQNDKEKVTQLLNINLIVGRKINGDLGIMQMIASPRPATTAQSTTPTTPPPSDISAPTTNTSGTVTPGPAPVTPSAPPQTNSTTPQTPPSGSNPVPNNK